MLIVTEPIDVVTAVTQVAFPGIASTALGRTPPIPVAANAEESLIIVVTAAAWKPCETSFISSTLVGEMP